MPRWGGWHDPAKPQVTGRQPRERGDHSAVGPVWFGEGGLAAEDCDLVPKYQDPDVLDGIAAGEPRHPAEQPDHEQAEEANEHHRPRIEAKVKCSARVLARHRARLATWPA